MPRCTRKGCGQEYTEGEPSTCTYHPGTPVFHEGLKSWSCCKDVNKPVLDFDEFMSIKGCTELPDHTSEKQKAAPTPAPKSETVHTASSVDASGKETFGLGTVAQAAEAVEKAPAPAAPTLEVDDLNQTVTPGTECRRAGCSVKFVDNETNRQGDGEGTVCQFHPLPPIFREGSKGYLCCKRRVLEFDEFLKIRGCKTGRHCFIPVVTEAKVEEEVNCRIDHYQTPSQVHVSVFAKQVDKERSSVTFQEDTISLELYLPNKKKFTKTLPLFGAIEPSASSYRILGTKVDLTLQKADGKSWTVLEKTDKSLGNISLTFGVGGRTGTVGGKEFVLDETNQGRA